jgi:hypothetical protein
MLATTSLVVGLIEIDHQIGTSNHRFHALVERSPVLPLTRLQENGCSECGFEVITNRFDANLSQLFRQLQQELVVFQGILSRAQSITSDN